MVVKRWEVRGERRKRGGNQGTLSVAVSWSPTRRGSTLLVRTKHLLFSPKTLSLLFTSKFLWRHHYLSLLLFVGRLLRPCPCCSMLAAPIGALLLPCEIGTQPTSLSYRPFKYLYSGIVTANNFQASAIFKCESAILSKVWERWTSQGLIQKFNGVNVLLAVQRPFSTKHIT